MPSNIGSPLGGAAAVHRQRLRRAAQSVNDAAALESAAPLEGVTIEQVNGFVATAAHIVPTLRQALQGLGRNGQQCNGAVIFVCDCSIARHVQKLLDLNPMQPAQHAAC